SEKWSNGPRTLHGVSANGFPNLFFMGITQNASSLNFTHMLDEQARHLTYIVSQVRERGASAVEVTADAEQEWLREMLSFATEEQRQRWAVCTPGYYNGQGDVDSAF